jgi:hypothetical protein
MNTQPIIAEETSLFTDLLLSIPTVTDLVETIALLGAGATMTLLLNLML